MTLDKTGVTEVFTFLGVSNFRNWGDAAALPLDRHHRRPVGQVENMTDCTQKLNKELANLSLPNVTSVVVVIWPSCV